MKEKIKNIIIKCRTKDSLDKQCEYMISEFKKLKHDTKTDKNEFKLCVVKELQKEENTDLTNKMFSLFFKQEEL